MIAVSVNRGLIKELYFPLFRCALKSKTNSLFIRYNKILSFFFKTVYRVWIWILVMEPFYIKSMSCVHSVSLVFKI